MKWWPFMFRSTHAAAVAQLRQDFARNLAERDQQHELLESTIRYHQSRAEVLDHRIRAAAAETQDAMAYRLGVSAAIHASNGKPICNIMAFRVDPASPAASVVALLAGPMTDGDIRRFREFNGGFAQDLAPAERVVIKIDKTRPEEPAGQ